MTISTGSEVPNDRRTRYFEKTVNASIAAASTETIFSKTGPLYLKGLYCGLACADVTSAGSLKITADGVIILNETFGDLNTYFTGTVGIPTNNEFMQHSYTAATLTKFTMGYNTYIKSSLLIEITNTSGANAMTSNCSITYDK